jgi:hypothetical protein
MRKQVLLSGLTAALIVFGATAAQAQRDQVYKSRKSSTIDNSQMAIDVSQFDPNVQIGEILRMTKMLVQQNEQLRSELTDMQRQLDTIEARGKAIGNSLNTTTGETIGSMVVKIKDKIVGM